MNGVTANDRTEKRSIEGFRHVATISYSIVPTPQKTTARFDGDKARCGGCNSVLGEFKSVNGEIKCKKNDCKRVNILKK